MHKYLMATLLIQGSAPFGEMGVPNWKKVPLAEDLPDGHEVTQRFLLDLKLAVQKGLKAE
jgi:hypothetical protein